MIVSTPIPLTTLFSRCVRRTYIHTPTHADYAYDRIQKHLILYFQDSDGTIDWLHNLDFPAVAYRRNGKINWYAHRGFLRVWESLIPRVSPLVTDKSLEKITIVGYSHGAALAVLCHEYVWYHRPNLRESLTGYGFGCPRVLWGHVTDELSQRWDRFTVIRNRKDIVTYVPPAFLGYHHVGHLLEIGEAGKYSAVDAHRAKNILRELWNYEQYEKLSKMQAYHEKIAKKP